MADKYLLLSTKTINNILFLIFSMFIMDYSTYASRVILITDLASQAKPLITKKYMSTHAYIKYNNINKNSSKPLVKEQFSQSIHLPTRPVAVKKLRGKRHMSTHTHTKDNNIMDENLARRLVNEQFPQWAHLPVKPVAVSGWDNRTFHLGERMILRFPSAEQYAAQVEKEQFWLPRLQPQLPLPIPEPIGLGKPTLNYPWKWSIYRWIDGDTLASTKTINQQTIAKELAQFLRALHKANAEKGPFPGSHNFYRGGLLTIYDNETQKALNILQNQTDTKLISKIWESAISTTWKGAPVWVHGDISPGNLLVKKNQLCAVIDFGLLAVGDPACDLSIAWNFFDHKARKVFRDSISIDDETWARGRAWALWKALIVTAKITQANPSETGLSKRVINEIIKDYRGL